MTDFEARAERLEEFLLYSEIGARTTAPDYAIEHPKLGRVIVYREYKPTKDTIEYTVYQKRERNHRSDFEIDWGVLNELTNEQAEGYVLGMMYAMVEWDYANDLEHDKLRGW